MQVRILGSNMEVGQSLTEYATENLNKDVKKYFENAVDAEVHFSKESHHLIKTTIIVNEGVKGGIVVKSNGNAADAYASFNESLEKATKQLRRYKRKITNYRRHGLGIKEVEPENYETLVATKYVIPSSHQNNNDEEIINDNVEIINEKSTDIERLTVDEAIMKMDLSDLPALTFVNRENNRINVVYHRKDGNISWVDPKN